MKTNLGGFIVVSLGLLAFGLYAQPVITSQPANQTVVWGGTATFSVMATGVGPLTYQWLCNGTNVPLNGIINTVAGNGAVVITSFYGEIISVTGTYSGDGGAATNAGLNGPTGVAVDAAGNLFIADAVNNRIRKVDTNSIITTLAGNGTNGFSGDGGAATNASLNGPSSLAVDATGNVFITDYGNGCIRKVDTNGVITTVAGNGSHQPYSYEYNYNYDNGSSFSPPGHVATNVDFRFPSGVAVDAAGNLLIADTGCHCISKVSTNGIITTVVGEYYNADNDTHDFFYPGYYSLDVQQSGSYSGDSGPAFTAGLNGPTGVTVDAAGNLFIADTVNNRIRKVSTNRVSVVLLDQYFQKGGQVIPSDIITTVAGGGSGGDGGAATSAGLFYPWGVAVDAVGNLFIEGGGEETVQEVGTNGIITTVAGNGTDGYSGDGGAATSASLGGSGFGSGPGGYLFNNLSVDAAGNLFIADTGNNRIRKVTFSRANLLANGSLVLNHVSPADSGNYSVIITSASGSVTSSVAMVSFQLPPVTAAFTASNGLCNFTWSAVSNLTYQLQCATNLVAPAWIDLGSPVTATNSSASAADVIGGDSQRFYRVRLWP